MTPPEQPEKHEEFWLDDGDLVLLVDGIYFKVHRVMLEQSCGLIKDTLALPPKDQPGRLEGSSIEYPLPIPGVSFDDFEAILRDAYNRQPAIYFKPDAENLVRLARAAHRMQAWRLLITAATEAMKLIPATERLVLHRELDLESISAAQKEEVNRQQRVSNGRAAARGLPQREFKSPEPLETNSGFSAAFFEVASTTSLALPVAGLDDKLNLQLVLARSALLEERRKRLAAYFEEHRDQFRLEAYVSVAGLDIRAETVDTWHNEQTTKGISEGTTLDSLRPSIPTESEDRATVLQFWNQSGQK